jgi:hypothetical protein
MPLLASRTLRLSDYFALHRPIIENKNPPSDPGPLAAPLIPNP